MTRPRGTELEALFPQEVRPDPAGGLRWTGASWLRTAFDYALPEAPAELKFRSRAHGWINQHFADDLQNKVHPDAYHWALDRVEAGLKPLATFDLKDCPEDLRTRFHAVRAARKLNTLLSASGNLGCATTLKPRAKLKEAFNLEALAKDYAGLVPRDRILTAGGLDVEGALAHANRTNDLDREWFWLRGLLFGFPVQATISILRAPHRTMQEPA